MKSETIVHQTPANEIHAPINHETTPHCIGCWVIRWTEEGLIAKCNECGVMRDLLPALSDTRPEVERKESHWEAKCQKAWADGDEQTRQRMQSDALLREVLNAWDDDGVWVNNWQDIRRRIRELLLEPQNSER